MGGSSSFSGGMLSGKKIIKNLIYNKLNQNMKDKEYKEITTLIKKEILAQYFS